MQVFFVVVNGITVSVALSSCTWPHSTPGIPPWNSCGQWLVVCRFSYASRRRCSTSLLASRLGVMHTYAAARTSCPAPPARSARGAGELQWMVRLSHSTRSPALQLTSLRGISSKPGRDECTFKN